MGRKTKGVIRERKDYTGLLLELQGQSPSPPPRPATAASEHKTPYSPYRQRIMSDEAVKYLYSKRDGQFHDKSCPKAQHDVGLWNQKVSASKMLRRDRQGPGAICVAPGLLFCPKSAGESQASKLFKLDI